MAEVTAFRNNALPFPVYGVPYAVTFPLLDADGDLVTGATGLDTEVSKNGDTFADCTNEAVEIATSSGVYYLLLTGTEMTADIVSVIVKHSTSGGKTTVLTLYPRKMVPLRSGTAQGGAAGSITLDASASAVDDFYNGCLVVGTLDGVTEARMIRDYAGATKVASVTPDWVITPDGDDLFTVYVPEGRQINEFNSAGLSTLDAAGVRAAVGLASANLDTQLTAIDDAVDTEVAAILVLLDTEIADIRNRLPAALVSGRMDCSVGAMAADTLTASALAADAVTEIQSDLATASAVATVDTVVDGIAALLTDTDTDVAAIRAVTDLLIAAQAEVTTLPASNATPLAKIAYLFQAVYHQLTVTNTKKTFYNGSNVAIYEQDLSDNGTTTTQTKVNAL